MEKDLFILKNGSLFQTNNNIKNRKNISKNDIAIIGMSCKYNNVNDVEEFWKKNKDGHSFVTELSDERKADVQSIAKLYNLKDDDIEIKKGAFLEQIDTFDPLVFKISPKEATTMDPDQRIFLETAWKAIEDAGYSKKSIEGSNTGIYVGYSRGEISYEDLLLQKDGKLDSGALSGNISSVIASRIAYTLDLKGPCITIDTACSSSLVTVHTACWAIRNHECDMAIAGGIKSIIFPADIKDKDDVGIASADGITRSFDDSAAGTGTSEGAGAILLKPLSQAIQDHDHIYAVIKGSAVNNDGHSIGITAPSTLAQEEVLIKSWTDANINPETIGYIEAHGTGTKLGDPIEIAAIQNAFSKYTDKKQFCAIGSIKANMGHADTAAGITGLIKGVLCLYHKVIPPLINFKRPNRKIDFVNSPIYVNDLVKNWETDGEKRRCGISSFGLSGTNCHIVIEEYENDVLADKEREDILTISSNIKDGLLKIAQSYYKFLCTHEVSLNQFCYSANARDVYPYRMAIIAESMELLKEKLKVVCENKEFDFEDIYIFHNCGNKSTEMGLSEVPLHSLFEMGKNYVNGADIDWKNLYPQPLQKISIPGYQFNKKRYWISLDTIEKRDLGLFQKIVDNMFVTVYEQTVHYEDNWVINEHRFQENGLLVGTAYLDWIIRVFSDYKGMTNIDISDLCILNPLVLREKEAMCVHITFQKGMEQEYVVTVAGKSPEAEDGWILFVKGKIEICSNNNAVSQTINDLIDGKEYIKKEYENAKEEETSELNLSKRWNGLQGIYVGNNESIGYIVLPQEYEDDLSCNFLHPALMDIALNCSISEETESYVPFSYEKITVYDRLEKILYAQIRKKETTSTSKFYDVDIFSAEGKLLVEVKNYSVIKMNKSSIQRSIYYEFEWEEKKLQDISKDEKPIKKHSLYFTASEKDEQEEAILTVHDNIEVIRIENFFNEEMFEHVFEKEEMQDVGRIIYAISSNLNVSEDMVDLRMNLEKTCYGLLRLIKSIKRNHVKVEELILLLNHADKIEQNEEVIPENRAIEAVAKVISQEYMNMKVISIDAGNGENLDLLKKELGKEELDSGYHHIAYRNEKRYIEIMKEAVTDIRNEGQEIGIKQNGVYVITGGTKGVGLELALHIAKKSQVKLVLISRSGLLDRRQWSDIITLGEDIPLIYQLQTILEIESTGSLVQIEKTDVANIEQMKDCIQRIRNQFGNINGVIHCAGCYDGKLLEVFCEKDFAKVLAPKVYGTWILNSLLKEELLDFVVLCSSITAYLGGAGQAAYAAANAFLNSYARANYNWQTKLISINWPSWEKTGMTADMDKVEDIFEQISRNEAVLGFDEALISGKNIVVIGKLNKNVVVDFTMPLPFEISTSIRNKYKVQKSNDVHQEIMVELEGREDNQYTETERKIASVWGEVLGMYQINVFDNFFALGGDSIYGMKIVNMLNEKYQMNIGINDILKHEKIADIAKHLQKMDKDMDKAFIVKSIEHVEQKERYSVSSSQRRLYYLQKMDGVDIAYNIPDIIKVRGQLESDKVKDTLSTIIRRHEILRTTFIMQDGEVYQKVIDDYEPEYHYIEAGNEQITTLIHDFIRPFDLDKDKLFRTMLVKTEKELYYLFFDFHHIITDWMSNNIFVDEFCKLYRGQEVEEVTVQYKDYAAWQNKLFSTSYMNKQKEYWLNVFQKPVAPLNLPTDFERPIVRSYKGERIEFILNKELSDRIEAYAKETGTTLFMVLLSFYNILLTKYSGQDEFVIGSACSGRIHQDISRTMGMFVNTLPLLNRPKRELTYYDFLMQVKENTLRAFENQDYSIDEIIRQLKIRTEEGRNALFETMFTLENIVPEQMEIQGMVFEHIDFEFNISKFDLSMYALKDEYIHFCIEYNFSLFRRASIEKMSDHFIKIIEQVMDKPEIAIRDINILDSNYETLINDFKSTTNITTDDFDFDL